MSPGYTSGREERVSNTNISTAHGFRIVAVLFLVFLILKLTHVIDWSWWAVTAPLWAPVALGFVVALTKGTEK